MYKNYSLEIWNISVFTEGNFKLTIKKKAQKIIQIATKKADRAPQALQLMVA